jgi:hypothetical protein
VPSAGLAAPKEKPEPDAGAAVLKLNPAGLVAGAAAWAGADVLPDVELADGAAPKVNPLDGAAVFPAVLV